MPHPKYQRKGDDLVYVHDFTLADALDCKSVELVTLDSRHLNIGIDEIIAYPLPYIARKCCTKWWDKAWSTKKRESAATST